MLVCLVFLLIGFASVAVVLARTLGLALLHIPIDAIGDDDDDDDDDVVAIF